MKTQSYSPSLLFNKARDIKEKRPREKLFSEKKESFQKDTDRENFTVGYRVCNKNFYHRFSLGLRPGPH